MCNFRKYFNDINFSIKNISKSINNKNSLTPLPLKTDKENILSLFSHLFNILSLIGFVICSFSIFKYLSSIKSSEYYISSINIEFITSILTIIITLSGILSLYLIIPSVTFFDKKDLTKKDLFLFSLWIFVSCLVFWISLVLFIKFREKLSISIGTCLVFCTLLSIPLSSIVLRLFIKIKLNDNIFSSIFILVINLLFFLFFSSFNGNLSWDEFTNKVIDEKIHFFFVFSILAVVNSIFLFIIKLYKKPNKSILLIILFFVFYAVFNTMYDKYIFIKLGFVDKDNVPYIIDKDFWSENNLKQREQESFKSVLQDGREKTFYIYCGKALWKLGEHYLFQDSYKKTYPIPKNRIRKYLGEDVTCSTPEEAKFTEENGD